MILLRNTGLLLVVACFTSAKPTNTLPTPVYPPPYITVVKESRSYPENGQFASYFEASNGIAVALEGTKNAYGGTAIIKGNYSYLQDDGSQAKVTFVADENGYQPSSDLIPVGPPMPAHSLLQIEKARYESSDESSEELSSYYSAPKITKAVRTYSTTSRPEKYTKKTYVSTITEEPIRYLPPSSTTKKSRSYTTSAYAISTTPKSRTYTTTTEEPNSPKDDSSEEVTLTDTTATPEPSTKRRKTYTRVLTTASQTTTATPNIQTHGVLEEDSSEEEIGITELPLVKTMPHEESSEEIVTVSEAPLVIMPPDEQSVEEDSVEEVITTTSSSHVYSPSEDLASGDDSEDTITTELSLSYYVPESEEESDKIKNATTTKFPPIYSPPKLPISEEDVSAQEASIVTTELPSEENFSKEESGETEPVSESLPRLDSEEETSSDEITTSATTSTSTSTQRPHRYLKYSRLSRTYKEVSLEEDVVAEPLSTTMKPSTTTRRRYTKPYYLRRITTPKPFIFKAPTVYFPQEVSKEEIQGQTESTQVEDESVKTIDLDNRKEEIQEIQTVFAIESGDSKEISSDPTSENATAEETFTIVLDDENTDNDIRDISSKQILTVDTPILQSETSPVDAINLFTVISDDDQIDSTELLDITLEETVSSEDSLLSSTLRVLADDSQESFKKSDVTDVDFSSSELVANFTEPSFKTLEEVFQEIEGFTQSLDSPEVSDKVKIIQSPTVSPLLTESIDIPKPRFTIEQSSEDLSLDLTSHEFLSSIETVTESAEDFESNENISKMIDDTSNETLEQFSLEDDIVPDMSSEELGLSFTTKSVAAVVDDAITAPSVTLDDVFAEIDQVVESLNSQESLEFLVAPAAFDHSTPLFTVDQSDENLSIDLLSKESSVSKEDLTVAQTQMIIANDLATNVNKTSEPVTPSIVAETTPTLDSVSSEVEEETSGAISNVVVSVLDSVSSTIGEGEIITESTSDKIVSVLNLVSSEICEVEVTTEVPFNEVFSEVLPISSEVYSDEILSEEVQTHSLEIIVEDTTESTDDLLSVEQLLTSYQAPSS